MFLLQTIDKMIIGVEERKGIVQKIIEFFVKLFLKLFHWLQPRRQ
ncbi:MAG: hypothetical protein AB4368_31245 [Xenococcaceae cyanobacterium]